MGRKTGWRPYGIRTSRGLGTSVCGAACRRVGVAGRRTCRPGRLRPRRNAGAAIFPRVFRPCVRVVRISSDNLSRRRMSPRITDYTRGQRKGTSETAFPAAAATAAGLPCPPAGRREKSYSSRRAARRRSQPVHLQVERRQHEQREQRRRDQAADHHDGQRPLDLGAVQAQHQQRQQAQRGRRRRSSAWAARGRCWPRARASPMRAALRLAGRASA